MSDIQIRLPDGKTLVVRAGSTVLSVAQTIGKGLGRAALAGRIDGRLPWDDWFPRLFFLQVTNS